MFGQRYSWMLLSLIVLYAGNLIAQDAENGPIKETFSVMHSGYEKEITLLVKDKKEWENISKRLALSPTPVADFSNDIVVLITAGRCSSLGYEVNIQQVITETERLVVEYTIASPIVGEPTVAISTTPACGVVIKKTEQPVEFVRIEKQQILNLVKKLGDDDWRIREKATDKLIKLGKISVPALLKSISDKDPEVVLRSRFILGEIVPTLLVERSGFIGIRTSKILSDDERIAGHLKQGIGIAIDSIVTNTPAEKFGLKKGDIIIGFNNTHLEDFEGFHTKIRTTPTGSKVALTLIRAGKKIDLELTLGVRPKKYQAEIKEILWKEWCEQYFPQKSPR